MDPFTVPSLTTVIGRMLPEPHAGFLAGILFGTRSTMAKELIDAFVTTGTIHIVALSGQNLSIFTGTLASWFSSIVSRRVASLLIIFILVWFLWFVGPSPSLVRAVIMGSLTLFAVIFGRRNLSLLSLALAVSTMLVLHPSWIGDLSFQLSVLATLGIILFGSKTTMEGRRSTIIIYPQPLFSIFHFLSSLLWPLIAANLRITLAAQLFTTPLIFFYFHRLSIIAPVTNVLIGWTMPFLMGLGWIAAIAGHVWLPLGLPPAWAAWVLLTYVIRAVEITANVPFSSVAW